MTRLGRETKIGAITPNIDLAALTPPFDRF
jgi:hypothetical protein